MKTWVLMGVSSGVLLLVCHQLLSLVYSSSSSSSSSSDFENESILTSYYYSEDEDEDEDEDEWVTEAYHHS